MGHTVTPKFYAIDRADNTWSECVDEKQAARTVERVRGDWSDPAIGYGALVRFDGLPERVFTESEVKAMLRSITHCTGSPLASIHINEVRRVFAEEHGIVLDPA